MARFPTLDVRMGQGGMVDSRLGRGCVSNTRDVPGGDYGAAGTYGDPIGKSMADGYRGYLRERPIPLLLARANPFDTPESPSQLVKIHVPLPATRIRARVEVVYISDDGQRYDLTAFGHTIDIFARDYTRGNVAGGRPTDVTEVTEVAGVPGPVVFPETPRLMGYSKEFETSADEIYVEVLLNPMGGLPSTGSWFANFRFEPGAGWGGSAAEWARLSVLCRPTRERGTLRTINGGLLPP